MTSIAVTYIENLFVSSVESGVLNYTDHDWGKHDPDLMNRKPVEINHEQQNDKARCKPICKELSWFVVEHLFKNDVDTNFHWVLQGLAKTIEQEKNFNHLPVKVLKNPAVKFRAYNPRTCSVPTFDVNDFRKIKSNIPYAEIAKGTLEIITQDKPLLQDRVQLLLDINQYLLTRDSGPNYKNKAASLFASIDLLGAANRCGMNFSKQQKLSAVKALRLAIINGDDISSLTNYKQILNSSNTKQFYQRYENILSANVANEDRPSLVRHAEHVIL